MPYTGSYKLHAGEQVVPAYDASKNGQEKTIVINNYVTSEAVARAMADKPGRNVINNVIVSSTQQNMSVRGVMRNA